MGSLTKLGWSSAEKDGFYHFSEPPQPPAPPCGVCMSTRVPQGNICDMKWILTWINRRLSV